MIAFHLNFRTALMCAALAALPWLPAARAQTGDVTVFHWWVSGGERASMDAIRAQALQRGLGWSEHSVAGSGTARYTDALSARVRAGQTPSAAQMIGYSIHAWARLGLLQSLDAVARREDWNEVVPMDIQHLSKWRGSWVAAPVNAHSTNWMWVNKAVADSLGATAPPDGWDDFIALLDKARAAGVLPLAMGREPWEHTLLFESVAAGAGGAQFYRRAFIDLDPEALQDTALLHRVFDRMRQLAGYLDAGFMHRRWDQASTLVGRGRALLQVQGSWVGGEFAVKGLAPERDYLCWRFPDTQGMYLFNSDQFVFFRQRAGAGQDALASLLMDPALQTAVNLRTGAAPARVDVAQEPFNSCGRRNIRDMRNANMRRAMMGSIAMGNAHPVAVKAAIYEVVTRHLRGELDTPAAVAALRSAVAQGRPAPSRAAAAYPPDH